MTADRERGKPRGKLAGALLTGLETVVYGIACLLLVIVTAEFEQPQTEQQLANLLLELGMLGVLVLALAAAIFLIRYSAAKRAAQ